LGIEAKFVKMLAHELKAKTVQRSHVRRFKQGKLLAQMLQIRGAGRPGQAAFGFGLQTLPDAPAHVRRRGFGERYHQDFIERDPWLFGEQDIQAPLYQRASLAGACARHNQHVPPGRDGSLLG
jgi:hypothetical protein